MKKEERLEQAQIEFLYRLKTKAIKLFLSRIWTVNEFMNEWKRTHWTSPYRHYKLRRFFGLDKNHPANTPSSHVPIEE